MLHNFETNARDGDDWMILEVDESDGTHLNFELDYAVCNFLELDHLNYYDGLDDIIDKMVEFTNGAGRLKEVFVNLDCEGNRRYAGRIDTRPTGYSLEHRSEFRAEILDGGQMPLRFEAFHRERSLGEFELNLFGRYNVLNAVGAIAVARRMGADLEAIREGIATYRGMENRFTVLRSGGATIVKDYQSHPTGIRKVLESARDLVDGRVLCVFKPYRYTLIHYLQDEYATAFADADEVVITTMYAADEAPIEGVDTEFVVDTLREEGTEVTHIPDQSDINDYLLEAVEPGDKVIFFGGDDFFRMADAFAAEYARRSEATEPEPAQPRVSGPLDTTTEAEEEASP
jgi:UDP-N-acetylmuramate--alanine ligase